MIRYNKFSNIFLAQEGATGGGGSAGNPAANQGGASDAGGGDVTVDPFAGIDLDDLDPATRKVMEAAKTSFASLQVQAANEKKAREHSERLARDFQGKHDGLAAQLQKLTSGGPPAGDPQVELLAKFTATLVAKGVTPEQAKVQAPLMLEMMQTYGETLKGEIGRDMAPFAGSVLQNEALASWNAALANDKFGALQVPEVAESVWAQTQTMIGQGQSVSPATIKNLTNMFYMEHLEKTGGQPPTTMSPQLPNVGTLRYPGAGHSPSRPVVVDANAPRYTLDAGTNAALQSVMSRWDVKPKAYQPTKR